MLYIFYRIIDNKVTCSIGNFAYDIGISYTKKPLYTYFCSTEDPGDNIIIGSHNE